MSLQFIYTILQQNKDPLIESLTSYEQFAEYMVVSKVSEDDAEDAEMRDQDDDDGDEIDPEESEEHQKRMASILSLRRYVYDKYVLGAGTASASEASEEKNIDVQRNAASTIDAPPFFVLHADPQDEESEEHRDATSPTDTTLPREQSYLHLKRALKYEKMIDLLEPSLKQKQDQINQLKIPPSLIKQSFIYNPSQKPKRIWKTNDEYLNILYDHLYRIWKEIYKHPSAWPFYKPVTEDVAPQYYDIITNPIDLSTMQRSLKNMTYTSKQEFFNDIYLMCENCRTYNTDLESPFRHKGNEIEDLARLLQNTVPDVIYVDRSGEDVKYLPRITQQPKPLVSYVENGEELIEEVLTLEKKLEQEERSASKEEKTEPATKARRGRSRRGQTRAQKEEESTDILDTTTLEIPSNLWLQKMTELHKSFTQYRHQQYQLKFEDQDAVERTPETMARFYLESHGYDLQDVDTTPNGDGNNKQSTHKEYQVVTRSRPHSSLPEYMPLGCIIPDLKQSSTGLKNSSLTVSSLKGDMLLNKTIGSLATPPLASQNDIQKDTNQRVFDFLQRDDQVSKQVRGLLQIQEMRLKQLNFLEEAQEVALSDVVPEETVETNPHTELPVAPALRSLVALFAAHSGFTHITSDAVNILSEVVDHYICSLGRNLNQFMHINTEVDEPIALLRVLGIMSERSSTPLMKREWDELMTGMDGVIDRSQTKYLQQQAPSTNGGEAPGSATANPPSAGGPASATTDDRKRKREDEPFQA
eukprot:CAMPEP_0117435312 /NCGR_PEP_ID=MMETSP0759-20121206/415_1 /TAXON_ID=63605 /ORGANISM="Percolomonas cosmopolitus, Strain WS" /LENGTH=755 /DNA_ID=CAMNT_0005226853 /DNA_START=227 /DNA_END=2490 /DNA_ORIENTATION=-